MAAALGFALPGVPNTTTGDGTRTALWLGPDEWLVLGPAGDEAALETLLAEALPRELGSVVGLSANRTVLELRGPAARDVLAAGCSLDLHPRAFGAGACAQTLLARAPVDPAPDRRGARLPDPRPRLLRRLPGGLAARRGGGRHREPTFSSIRRRQRSVRPTSLNVYRWKPAMSAAGSA